MKHLLRSLVMKSNNNNNNNNINNKTNMLIGTDDPSQHLVLLSVESCILQKKYNKIKLATLYKNRLSLVNKIKKG